MRIQRDSVDGARASVARGMAGLAGVQAVQVLVPLLTLPYLTRVLGAEGWGTVAAVWAVGGLAATIPEYGFSVSASRALARFQSDSPELPMLVANVVAAKALLAVVAVGVVVAVYAAGGMAAPHAALVVGACLIAAGQGMWMAWYFEGREQAPVFLRAVLAGRVAYVLLLFALVRSAADGVYVPLLFGLTTCGVTALALRNMPWRGVASWPAVRRVLRANAAGFAQRVLVMSYAAGNVFWLSLLAAPREVGGYSVAEQSVRAACLLLIPLNRALYPRYSRRAQGTTPERWMRFTRSGMLALGALLSLAAFAGAGLVPFVFGSAYAPFVGLVRVLSPLPLLVAASQYWTVQGLLAHGRDRAATALFAMGAAVNLALAFVLVPRYGAAGMCVALIAAETCVTAGSFALARRHLASLDT